MLSLTVIIDSFMANTHKKKDTRMITKDSDQKNTDKIERELERLGFLTLESRTNPVTGIETISASQGRPVPQPLNLIGFNNVHILDANGAHQGYQGMSRPSST